MPAQRRRVIEHLSTVETTSAPKVGTVLGLPTTTARRTLEDLAAHGLVEREKVEGESSDAWKLAGWAHSALALTAVPEMSVPPLP